MSHLTRWIGKLLFFVMALALIAYAASRTLDFVSKTLGEHDQVIGYLALFATTGGALAWLAVFLWDSEGIAQKGISLVMIVLDVAGEITLFTIDTLMQSGNNGMVATLAPEEIRLTVLGMSALIGVNIIATFAFHIANPGNLERIEAHFADWKIKQAIQKAKAEKAEAIADEIAEREAEAYALAQKAKDRSDKTQDERTVAQVIAGMGNWLSNLGMQNSSKRDDIPLVAVETVKAKLTEPTQKYPDQLPPAEGMTRPFRQAPKPVPAGTRYPLPADDLSEAEPSTGASFQDEEWHGGMRDPATNEYIGM